MQIRNSKLELVSPVANRKTSGKVAEKPVEAACIWAFGEFKLDLATERLSRRGEPVLLRRRPFQVLVYLIERRDRLVEQAELLEAIWGGAPVYHDALRKAVGSIRSALGDNSQTPAYVETHWGRGYRFIGEVSVAETPAAELRWVDDLSFDPPAGTISEPEVSIAPARPWISKSRAMAGASLAFLLVVCVSAALYLQRFSARKSQGTAAVERSPATEDQPDAYREAQFLLSQRNTQGIQRAIEIFNGMVADRSNAGDAYAALAECYALGYWGFWKIDPEVAAAKSAEYARKAVQASPSSAYAHAQLAASYVREWRVRDAQSEFQRSLALRPDDAEVHHAYAVFLDDTRRADQGIREMQRAIELQPLSLAYKTDLGMSYFFAHRFPDAIAEYDAVLKLDPHYSEAREYLASMYVFEGRWREAKAEYAAIDRLRGDRPGDHRRTALRLLTMLHTGEQVKARAGIESIASSPTTENAYYLADIYAQLGRTSDALIYLRKLVEARSPGAFALYSDPLLDPLRGNPEFESLSARVLEEGNSPDTTTAHETTLASLSAVR